MAGVSGEQPQAAEGAYSDDDEVFIDGKEASGFHVVADITGNQDGAPCSTLPTCMQTEAATSWQHLLPPQPRGMHTT